jgi:hypothetical protein
VTADDPVDDFPAMTLTTADAARAASARVDRINAERAAGRAAALARLGVAAADGD